MDLSAEIQHSVPGRKLTSEGADKRTEEFRKVAKEMESLFAYQLLKIMRETANNLSAEKKGTGHNTYMGLFDMEVSKLFAERGLGLQDAIMNWLERIPAETNRPENNDEEPEAKDI